MEAQVPSPLAAQCQIHAGQPFTAVCQRCGAYMCTACTEGGRFNACAACRERGGVFDFPFRRDAYTFSGLYRHAFEAYKRNWLTISLAMFLGFAALMAASFGFSLVGMLVAAASGEAMLALPFQVLSGITQFGMQGILTLGTIQIALTAVRGQRVEVSQMFTVWPKVGAWVVQTLVTGALFLPVGLIALVGVYFAFPGMFSGQATEPSTTGLVVFGLLVVAMLPVVFYVMIGLSFANTELVAQPVSAIQAMHNSWALTRGKRLEFFGLMVITWFLMVSGFLLCFVGALFTMGYATCVFATYYLALRNGAEGLRS